MRRLSPPSPVTSPGCAGWVPLLPATGSTRSTAHLCSPSSCRLPPARRKRLRSLAADSLPLRVVSVQPLAPVLRHAAAFPPLPHLLAGAPHDALASEHVARCLEPVALLCQLEGSGASLLGWLRCRWTCTQVWW